MLDRLCHSDLLCLLNRDRGPARLGQLQQVLPQLCQVSVDQATVVNSPDLHVRDTVITCLVNTATCLLAGTVTFSILGHMAHNQGVDVASVSII